MIYIISSSDKISDQGRTKWSWGPGLPISGLVATPCGTVSILAGIQNYTSDRWLVTFLSQSDGKPANASLPSGIPHRSDPIQNCRIHQRVRTGQVGILHWCTDMIVLKYCERYKNSKEALFIEQHYSPFSTFIMETKNTLIWYTRINIKTLYIIHNQQKSISKK